MQDIQGLQKNNVSNFRYMFALAYFPIIKEEVLEDYLCYAKHELDPMKSAGLSI